MKKAIISLLFASLLVLSGCSNGAESTADPYTADTLNTLVSSSVFSEVLEPLDSDITVMLYQLDARDISSCSSIRSTGATCEEGAVLICTDASAAARVATGLKSYVDAQIISNENYRPAEIPKLQNAQIDIRDNTILFVIANDISAISKAIG